MDEKLPICAARDAPHQPGNQAPLPVGNGDQVRNAVDKANKRLYGKRAALHFRDSQPAKTEEVKIASVTD